MPQAFPTQKSRAKRLPRQKYPKPFKSSNINPQAPVFYFSDLRILKFPDLGIWNYLYHPGPPVPQIVNDSDDAGDDEQWP